MTESDVNAPERRRAPGWMKALLGVSLALNVLIVAAVAGFAIRHGGPGGGGGFRDMAGLARFVPEEKRDVARTVLDANRDAFQDARQKMQAARQAAEEVFIAEPYDPEAVIRALDEVRAAGGEMLDLTHHAMADIGARLTPEERAEVVEKFRERSRRWRERREERREERRGEAAGN